MNTRFFVLEKRAIVNYKLAQFDRKQIYHLIHKMNLPRSNVTDSANGRIREKYSRKRPYFAVIHVIVLRSYISVTVYGAIRSHTGENRAKWRSYTASVY
jgi:hypothetical protein